MAGERAHDPVDAKLISLLRADGRRSVASMGKELNLSRTAVQTRLQRLLRDRSILGFTAILPMTSAVPTQRSGLAVVRRAALQHRARTTRESGRSGRRIFTFRRCGCRNHRPGGYICRAVQTRRSTGDNGWGAPSRECRHTRTTSGAVLRKHSVGNPRSVAPSRGDSDFASNRVRGRKGEVLHRDLIDSARCRSLPIRQHRAFISFQAIVAKVPLALAQTIPSALTKRSAKQNDRPVRRCRGSNVNHWPMVATPS